MEISTYHLKSHAMLSNENFHKVIFLRFTNAKSIHKLNEQMDSFIWTLLFYSFVFMLILGCIWLRYRKLSRVSCRIRKLAVQGLEPSNTWARNRRKAFDSTAWSKLYVNPLLSPGVHVFLHSNKLVDLGGVVEINLGKLVQLHNKWMELKVASFFRSSETTL